MDKLLNVDERVDRIQDQMVHWEEMNMVQGWAHGLEKRHGCGEGQSLRHDKLDDSFGGIGEVTKRADHQANQI